MNLTSWRIVAAVLLGFQVLPTSAAENSIRQTIFFKGNPTSEEIRDWSKLPCTTSYRIELDYPSRQDLETLKNLPCHAQLQLMSPSYPRQSESQAWAELARRSAELVILGALPPNSSQTEIINTIGFSRVVLVLKSFPSLLDARQIAQIKSPIGITFATGRYPLFDDREALSALPSGTLLSFATDYWPSYSHMDLLNLLPLTKRLRVTGIFPTELGFTYLRALKSIDEIIIETDFAPVSGATWAEFGTHPLRWSLTGAIPSREALEAFKTSGAQRKIVVNRDAALTREETERLMATGLEVEWIHQ